LRRNVTSARAAHERDRARVLRRVPARLPDRLLQPLVRRGAQPVREGAREVRDPLRLPDHGDYLALPAWAALLLAHARLVLRRDGVQRAVRRLPAARCTERGQPGLAADLAADRR